MQTSDIKRLVLLAALFLLSAISCQLRAAELKIRDGLTAENGVLTIDKGRGEGTLLTAERIAAGKYVLEGEYQTGGDNITGKFAIDVKSPDGKNAYSAYSWTPTATEWVPLRVYVWLKDADTCQIRFGNFQGFTGGAQLRVRNLSLKPFALKGNENWLVNGGWSGGKIGEVPPGWEWKGKAGVPVAGLARNTSYKSGNHVLRIEGAGTEPAILASSAMPLPEKGDLELSLNVKGSGNGGKIILHVVTDGWAHREEKGYPITEGWTTINAVLRTKPEVKRDSFFVRFDVTYDGVAEIADARVVWHPEGAQAESGDSAYLLGWQGVPGRNLVYNPEFELGGAGYIYDYPWPKEPAHFEGISRNKPNIILEGKGVNGGACMFVQNGSLRSFCYPVTPGKTYTYSVALRAPEGVSGAKASVISYDSEWRCGLYKTVSDIPSDRWQRYSWTEKWTENNIQRKSFIRVDTQTGVLVDQLQVVEGDLAEYEPPAVMLGLMFEGQSYFMRGRDKTQAKIRIAPGVRQSGTATIEVIARDAWRREAWKKTFDAPLDKITDLPVDIPDDRLGNFQVELTAKIADKAAGFGLSRYAIIDKPVLQETSLGNPGMFGICQESFNDPVWICESNAKIHTDLGVRLNRFFAFLVPMDFPSPLPKSLVDDLLAKSKPFREAGIDMMACIPLMPKSAAGASHTLEMPKQKDLDAWGTFMKDLVSALKSEIKYWEIFNEPNLFRVGSGPDRGKPTMPGRKYFEYQKVAYEAAKAADPQAQVVCNAMNNLPIDWLDEWLGAGGGKYMDIFSFHPYGWTNFYPESLRLRQQLASHGFTKPIANTEKYFGTNVFQERAGYEETRRGYYLPHDMELATAGRTLQHMISHAAGRIPFCAFYPQCGSIFALGPENVVYTYDYFPAMNTATRFLVPAGEGTMLQTGTAFTVFVFPEAEGGPLMTIATELLRVEGMLVGLTGDYEVYDMMGNPLPTQEVARTGIRVAVDPTYIRFKPGTTLQEIEAAVQKSDVVGLGDPFGGEVAVKGQQELAIMVSNYRNRPLSGTVKLLSLPEGWQAKEMTVKFEELAAGKTMAVPFPMTQMQVKSMLEYPVSFVIEAGEDYVRRESLVRPLFASRLPSFTADGKLEKWAGAEWIALGGNNLSKDFSLGARKHTDDKDLSARFACGWNAEGFALVVEVTDDKFQPAESERVAWEGDSVQVYFDPLNDAQSGNQRIADDVIYTLALTGGKPVAWVEKGAEGNYKGAANKEEGFHDVDVQLAIVHNNGKTIYEAFFPRVKCLPAARLEAGGSIGFSLLINDNDGAGRKTGLTLAPAGKEPYNAAAEYRDVILRP